MISEQVFQSTHPCGVRLEAVEGRPQLHKVSIHAPLRGATQLSRPGGLFAQVSIHAPLRGATSTAKLYPVPKRGFNPRTPAGCDFITLLRISIARAFQSTHPCGVRLCEVGIVAQVRDVSIHAPLRGATDMF